MKAIWNGKVLVESSDTVVIEGNHYFPVAALIRQYFKPSNTHTQCAWKGRASYYDIVVDGQVNENAAWYYPEPSDAAQAIKDRVAFWHGISVTP